MTEAEIFAVVRKWRDPNGDKREWIVLPHVRGGSGAHNDRTCDAIAMNAWPSRGLEIEGFEFKSYASDWRRELEQPEKAEQIFNFCDRWYVVAPERHGLKRGTDEPDPKIKLCPITLESVPVTWGFLVVEVWRDVPKIRMVKLAPKLKPKEPGRRFIAALLRSLVLETPAEQLETATAAGYTRGHKQGLTDGKAAAESALAYRRNDPAAELRWRKEELESLEKSAERVLKSLRSDLKDLKAREIAPPPFVDEQESTDETRGSDETRTDGPAAASPPEI